jgi:hypothetical protein
MRVGRRRAGDRGSAIVEFIVVGVGVLVPVAYLVQALMVVHTASLATSQAAREAGRAFSTASTPELGRQRAAVAARIAFADQGLVTPDRAVRVSCVDGPCLAPGSAVVVEVDWAVNLPWLPQEWAAAVPVSAVQRIPIDDFRSSPA